MHKKQTILCIGAVIADLVCELPHLLSSGEGLVVNASRLSLGGCAFNNVNIIRQLQAPAALFAPLGNGIYASFIRQELERLGLSGQEVAAELDSGLCVCMVEPSGERTMFTLPGIERHYQAEWFANLDGKDYAAAIVGGYEVNGMGGDAIVGFLQDYPQLLCYFAPGPTAALIDKQKIAQINALRPIWHLNEKEAEEYSGAASLAEAGWFITQQSGNAVVITAGSNGAFLFDPSQARTDFAPTIAAEVQPVVPVDTIGAGDAHLGALAAARARGWDWSKSLELANRVAAKVCLNPGPTLPDTALIEPLGSH